MNFARLHLPDGQEIFVNADHVINVMAARDGGAFVQLTPKSGEGGHAFVVTEEPLTVVQKLQGNVI